LDARSVPRTKVRGLSDTSTSKETRKKFAEFLIKTKEWIKVKKVPQLPFYTGKKIRADE